MSADGKIDPRQIKQGYKEDKDMVVTCEMKCVSNENGYCKRPEISIVNGKCESLREEPEFTAFREDNVVLFDKAGLPSIMVKFTRDPEKPVHPMFVIENEIYDEIYISKYPNVIIKGKAYSLPMQEPAVDVTLRQAERVCFNKGKGWHLMTAMERGYIANLCYESSIFPHGNTNNGAYYADTGEKGITFDETGKTLTGSGPKTWTHDHTVFGIHDLCGNVWEWFRGLRLMDGVLQVAENNDAASNIDLSEDSRNWKPVLDGEKPVRLDCTRGEIAFTTCQNVVTDYNGSRWGDVNFDCEQTQMMKDLGLFPGEPDTYLYANTGGERLLISGGPWNPASGAGMFTVDLDSPRSNSDGLIGFRSAYYCKHEGD